MMNAYHNINSKKILADKLETTIDIIRSNSLDKFRSNLESYKNNYDFNFILTYEDGKFLREAAVAGNLAVLEFLFTFQSIQDLYKSLPCDKGNNTPLALATIFGNNDCVRFLLDQIRKNDPDMTRAKYHNNSAIIAAMNAGNQESFDLLIAIPEVKSLLEQQLQKSEGYDLHVLLSFETYLSESSQHEFKPSKDGKINIVRKLLAEFNNTVLDIFKRRGYNFVVRSIEVGMFSELFSCLPEDEQKALFNYKSFVKNAFREAAKSKEGAGELVKFLYSRVPNPKIMQDMFKASDFSHSNDLRYAPIADILHEIIIGSESSTAIITKDKFSIDGFAEFIKVAYAAAPYEHKRALVILTLKKVLVSDLSIKRDLITILSGIPTFTSSYRLDPPVNIFSANRLDLLTEIDQATTFDLLGFRLILQNLIQIEMEPGVNSYFKTKSLEEYQQQALDLLVKYYEHELNNNVINPDLISTLSLPIQIYADFTSKSGLSEKLLKILTDTNMLQNWAYKNFQNYTAFTQGLLVQNLLQVPFMLELAFELYALYTIKLRDEYEAKNEAAKDDTQAASDALADYEYDLNDLRERFIDAANKTDFEDNYLVDETLRSRINTWFKNTTDVDHAADTEEEVAKPMSKLKM